MKYFHVWFQTKFRKRVLIDDIDKEVNVLFESIAKEKGINLIAHGTMPNHAHLLLALKEKDDLSGAVKNLKGVSARRIFQEFPILKEQFRINNLWARKFGYKEIPEKILPVEIQYVRNQKKDLHLI